MGRSSLTTVLAAFILGQFTPLVFAQQSNTFEIESAAMPAGGGDDSRSDNYILEGTIGEPFVGASRSVTYDLDSGYRQPTNDAEISIGCDPAIDIGTITFTGQSTGSGSCTIHSSAGYNLSWKAVTPETLTDGLVGWWRMDETTAGSTVIDASGNGNDGTPNGTSGANNKPQPSTDVPTNYHSVRSLDFDGTDDYVFVTDESSLQVTSALSVSAWVRTESFAGFPGILSKNDDDGFVIWIDNSSGKLSARVGGTQVNAGNLSLEIWQHIVLTYNGSYKKLFINGEESGSLADTSNANTANSGLRIGNWNGFTREFNGQIDNVRIYNRALSSAEIRILASKAPPGALTMSGSQVEHIPPFSVPTTGGLVGHWKMDELSAGDTVLDWSGNNNDGTPNGTGGTNNKPQPSTDCSTGTVYKNSGCFIFDGTDDYVNIADDDSLNVMEPLTLSLWLKQESRASKDTTLLNKDDESFNERQYRIYIDNDSTHTIHFRGGDGESNYSVNHVDGNTVIQTGRWYYVAATYDGSKATIYIDGSEDASFSKSGNIGTGNGTLKIGRANSNNGFEFDGLIDDIRIYNRALSQGEIKALYSATQPWDITDTSAYWGARLSSTSTDIDSKWGTDGSSDKWIAMGDGDFPVVTRETATGTGGSTEIFDLRVEVGSDMIQPAGTYVGLMIMTASSL